MIVFFPNFIVKRSIHGIRCWSYLWVCFGFYFVLSVLQNEVEGSLAGNRYHALASTTLGCMGILTHTHTSANTPHPTPIKCTFGVNNILLLYLKCCIFISSWVCVSVCIHVYVCGNDTNTGKHTHTDRKHVSHIFCSKDVSQDTVRYSSLPTYFFLCSIYLFALICESLSDSMDGMQSTLCVPDKCFTTEVPLTVWSSQVDGSIEETSVAIRMSPDSTSVKTVPFQRAFCFFLAHTILWYSWVL